MKTGVLLVTTGYPRRHGDIAGSFLTGLARELARQYTITVIAPDAPGALPVLSDVRIERFVYMWPRRFQALAYGAGIPDNIRSKPGRTLLAPTFCLSMYCAVKHMVSGYQAAVSNWLVPSSIITAAALRRTAIPHVAIAHGSDIHLLRRLPGRRRLARYILRRTSAVITVAAYMKSMLLEAAELSPSAPEAERIVTLPMGFDPVNVFDGHRSFRDLKKAAPGVLYIGRLVPVKGVDVLIRAAAMLQEHCPVLHIAGDGPQRRELERLAGSLNVSVRFYGMVSPLVRNRLFRECDIAVFPSDGTPGGRSEGVPVSLLEAMAAGLPVVAARSGGIPDVIGDGVSGLLIPPGRPGALAAAMETLIAKADTRRRLGESAAQAARRFSWDALGEQYRSVLSDVLGNRFPSSRRC